MNRKKKVYFCVTNDLRFDQRLTRMGNSVKALGTDVVLVGRRPIDDSKLNIELPHSRITCFFKGGPALYVEYNLKLLFLLLIRKWDVVVANDADTLMACGLAAYLRRKTLVYDSHELFTEVPELKGKNFKRWIWHMIQRLWVPSARLAITVGPKLAVRLSDMYHKKFHSIRNVPFMKEVEGKRQNRVLLYQGTLNVKRGLEEALLALVKLEQWSFWIVGTGPLERDLKQMVIDLGLKDRVVFYGGVSPDQLHPLTCTATVGINILHGDSLNYYFSLANKFFDYVQAEIPSICMSFPEYQALNDTHEVAVLIEKCEVDHVVEAVKALEDAQLIETLSNNCKLAKKDWNWEKEEVLLKTIYQTVLE